ncbi:MAG: response regulator, partial [Spirochaetaceae bacterium]|nr:response regulator [Spirochaetaceae bacterium]
MKTVSDSSILKWMFQPGRRFSLLIVDDEELVRDLHRTVFAEDDYLLHMADDGQEALRVLSKVIVDAALVDLQMPRMDGLTLLKEIKGKYPGIMVV